MSMWYEIEEIEAIEISDDGKTIEVLFQTDRNGNNYVDIPIEFIKDILDRQVDGG